VRVGGENPSHLDLIHVRKMGLQVSVALIDDQVLAGRLSVVSEHLVDHVHTIDDGTKWGEARAVEAYVVGVVDEELGCAGIGSGGGEDDASTLVALEDGIILDFGDVPYLVDRGICAEPELHDKAGNDAKEGGVGEVAIAYQVVEAVSTDGRPVAMDFDDEVARCGGEHRLEDRGRLEL